MEVDEPREAGMYLPRVIRRKGYQSMKLYWDATDLIPPNTAPFWTKVRPKEFAEWLWEMGFTGATTREEFHSNIDAMFKDADDKWARERAAEKAEEAKKVIDAIKKKYTQKRSRKLSKHERDFQRIKSCQTMDRPEREEHEAYDCAYVWDHRNNRWYISKK